MRLPTATAALPLLAACALLGCEDAETKKGVSWNGSSRPATTVSSTAATTAAEASAATTTTTSSTASTRTRSRTQPTPAPDPTPSDGGSAGDAVPFSSLNWTYGGVNASGAKQSGVVISGLSCSRSGLSFRYVKNLSAWGRSNSQAADLACLFVQRSDGRWVGGKFDWISSSRTSRGFENILHEHYNGWSLAGVPNPCNVAFVIVNNDHRRRSNVIAGRWSR